MRTAGRGAGCTAGCAADRAVLSVERSLSSDDLVFAQRSCAVLSAERSPFEYRRFDGFDGFDGPEAEFPSSSTNFFRITSVNLAPAWT